MTICKCGRIYTAGVTWDSYDAIKKENKKMKDCLIEISGDHSGYGDPDLAVDCLEELEGE